MPSEKRKSLLVAQDGCGAADCLHAGEVVSLGPRGCGDFLTWCPYGVSPPDNQMIYLPPEDDASS